MSDTMKIEQLSADNFDELMQALLTAFRAANPSHQEFDLLYPDLYQPTDEKMSNHYVIRLGGKIASCVGLYPVKLNLCDRIVELGGIGAVATIPEYRGKGLMQTILDYVMKVQIEERQYPISLLGGDRRRYQPWGFEQAHTKYSFILTKRAPGLKKYLGRLTGKIKQGKVDELDWSELWQQAQSNPDMCACGEEDLKLKYKRLGRYVVMVEGDKGAHIVAQDIEDGVVIQSYAGDVETLGALIAEKLNSDQWQRVDARLPMYPNKYCGMFKELMVDYGFGYTGKIAVLNVAKAFEIFLPHFNQRVSSLGLRGKVLLKITPGIARVIPAQAVIIEADGNELNVSADSDKSGAVEVELNCHQLVELMFSPLCIGWSYRLAPKARWLAALMPVPYYIPPLYHI